MFARASAGCFLTRMMCNPSRAGVAVCGDSALVVKELVSLVGLCWRWEVATVDLGVGSAGQGVDLEEAISKIVEGCLVAYSDGSRDELGRVVGG